MIFILLLSTITIFTHALHSADCIVTITEEYRKTPIDGILLEQKLIFSSEYLISQMTKQSTCRYIDWDHYKALYENTLSYKNEILALYNLSTLFKNTAEIEKSSKACNRLMFIEKHNTDTIYKQEAHAAKTNEFFILCLLQWVDSIHIKIEDNAATVTIRLSDNSIFEAGPMLGKIVQTHIQQQKLFNRTDAASRTLRIPQQ